MRRALWPAGLAAIALVTFWPLRGVYAGRVLYQRDVHIVWHAQVEGFVRAVAGGGWPLWDPSPAFGQPLLADPSAMVAYPPTWLNLLMPAWAYYSVFAVLHLAWTSLGTCLLARRWRMSQGAAATATALWGLSGPILSLVDLWHHYASAAWIPWVFLAAQHALTARSGRAVLGLCGAMGAQMLAGSADMTLMTGLAVALYATRYVRWRRPLAPRNRRMVLRGALAVAGATALSAVMWAPALELVARSQRRALPEQVRTFWSVHPLGMLQALVSDLWYGVALNKELSAALFESREPFLSSLYLGAAGLALAASAAFAGPKPRRRFLALLALGAALVALGRHAPFYSAAVAVLPPLRMVRYPTKAFVMVAFAWALLCGLGFDAWRSGKGRRWVLVPVVLWTFAAAAAALGLWVRGNVDRVAALLLAPGAPVEESAAILAHSLLLTAGLTAGAAVLATARQVCPAAARPLAAAAAVLAALDLAYVHAGLNELAPRQLYARTPVVDVLRREHARRVYVYDYSYADGSPHLGGRSVPPLAGVPPGWSVSNALALGQQMHLMPPIAGRWDIDTAYDLDLRGLYPWGMSQLTIFIRRLEGTPAHRRLLQAGATTHVVALHDEGFEDLRPVARLDGVFVPPVRVFAVPEPLPRAYAVAGVVRASGAAAFAALIDPAVDLRRAVVLPEPASAAPPAVAGRVEELERRADRVRLRAHMDRDGWVVLVDAHDEGWRARVDGEPRPLLNANVAFRAVQVPAGTHEVDMRYRPAGALWGGGTSLATALVLAGIALRGGRRGA